MSGDDVPDDDLAVVGGGREVVGLAVGDREDVLLVPVLLHSETCTFGESRVHTLRYTLVE